MTASYREFLVQCLDNLVLKTSWQQSCCFARSIQCVKTLAGYSHAEFDIKISGGNNDCHVKQLDMWLTNAAAWRNSLAADKCGAQKRKGHQGDCSDHHWRRWRCWRQTSISSKDQGSHLDNFSFPVLAYAVAFDLLASGLYLLAPIRRCRIRISNRWVNAR